MYKVFVNKNLFCDSRSDDLALINPIVTNKVNQAGSFVFAITKEHPFYDVIQKRTSLVEVFIEDDEEPIFEGICTSEEIDFYGTKKMICEGALTFLNDSIQRQVHYQGYTSRQLLEAYLNNHNSQVEDYKKFNVGIVTAKDSNDSITCFTNYNSTMKEVKEDLIDDIGGFFRIRHINGERVLDYLAESPRTAEQTIELGKNLLNYSSNLDATNICTVLIPLGANTGEQTVLGLDDYVTIASVNDGKDYIESSSIGTYGRVTKTANWNDVNVPSILKEKAEKYLIDEQFENVVLKITAVDFGMLTDRFDRFRLLDQIRVISSVHGMDRYFVLTEQVLNLNEPEKDKITLGKEEKLSLSARTTQNTVKVENVPTSDQLTSAINNATNLLKGVEGGHIKIKTENGKPQEILIMDSDDEATATKIWRWNLNGFGYSNDGGQSYGTAITMDGSIVADYINGGTINGININGSVFSASGSITYYPSAYKMEDIDYIEKILVHLIEPTEEDYEKFDLNGNGVIDIDDGVLVLQLLKGVKPSITLDTSAMIDGVDRRDSIRTLESAIGPKYVRSRNIIAKEYCYAQQYRVKGENGYDVGMTGEFKDQAGHTIRVNNGIIVGGL